MDFITMLIFIFFTSTIVAGWLIVFIPIILPLVCIAMIPVTMVAYLAAKILRFKMFTKEWHQHIFSGQMLYPKNYYYTQISPKTTFCSCIKDVPKLNWQPCLTTIRIDGENYFKRSTHSRHLPKEVIFAKQFKKANDFVINKNRAGDSFNSGLPISCMICPVRRSAAGEEPQMKIG